MDQTSISSRLWLRCNLPAGLVGGVGALLLGAASWHLVTTHISTMIVETNTVRFVLELVEAGLITVPPILLVYLGYRTSVRDLPRECQWRILYWVLVGLTGVVGVITAVNIHRVLLGYPPQNSLVVMELLTGAGVGSLLGFAVGNNRISSDLQAKTIEDQRDAFLFLNRLLRHHILNSIQLIDGYTAQLENYDDDDLHQMREIVQTRSQEITSVIRNVQTIVSSFTDTPQLESLNLTTIVASECDKAREAYETAEFEVDLPEAVYVESNELLIVVLRHLIDNAVQHNDQATPRIHVNVENHGQTARVRISDNGPGISTNDADRCIDPGEAGDRGTGLYLANRVVSQQGGQLLFEDNSPRGTTVTVELPKPTAQSHTRSNESRPTTDPDTDPAH